MAAAPFSLPSACNSLHPGRGLTSSRSLFPGAYSSHNCSELPGKSSGSLLTTPLQQGVVQKHLCWGEGLLRPRVLPGLFEQSRTAGALAKLVDLAWLMLDPHPAQGSRGGGKASMEQGQGMGKRGDPVLPSSGTSPLQHPALSSTPPGRWPWAAGSG